MGLELELDDEVDADPETRRELLRILGEAISNATHHGKASKIYIRLSSEPALRLAIADDGCGFDAGGGAPPSNGGFGLTSMRERAEALGGELRVHSRQGEGTEVEVVLP
jgi:signal transduction histidine kinase